jgi:enoyl-CoA hydratase/carnithine racemase
MSSDIVSYRSVDGVAVITIERPEKRNALNAEVGEGLLAAWGRFNESEDRAAILTGGGGGGFSAGADLEAPPEIWRFTPGIGIDVEKPIIAAVDGWCVGGALVLVQFCDLCVATEDARFIYPEAKVGLSGGLISSLVARIPHKVAMELVLLGEPMSAQRAYEVGLVNKVVPPGQHMDAAHAYAAKLKANAPLVLAMLKRFTGRVLPKGPTELAGIARREAEILTQSRDFAEGVASFREKRPPEFKGE